MFAKQYDRVFKVVEQNAICDNLQSRSADDVILGYYLKFICCCTLLLCTTSTLYVIRMLYVLQSAVRQYRYKYTLLRYPGSGLPG